MNFLNNILGKIFIQERIGNLKIKSDFLLSKDFLREKEWGLRIFFDDVDYFETYYFINALKKKKIKEILVFFTNDYKSFDFKDKYETSYERVKPIFLNYLIKDEEKEVDYLSNSIIITDTNVNFIVHIDIYKENFYFYGDKHFLQSIPPVDFAVYKDYYFSYIDDYNHSYLTWLWNNYIKGLCS